MVQIVHKKLLFFFVFILQYSYTSTFLYFIICLVLGVILHLTHFELIYSYELLKTKVICIQTNLLCNVLWMNNNMSVILFHRYWSN